MKRPFCGPKGTYCGRALKDQPLDKLDDSVPREKKQCVACWLALNDPEYQRLWGIPASSEGDGKVDLAALTPKNGPCGAC